MRTGLPIAGNGTVSVSWQITPEPVPVAKMRLSQLTGQVGGKAGGGPDRGNGKQVKIDTITLNELSSAQAAITAGHITTYSVVTAEGDVVSVNGTQLSAAINAIVDHGRRSSRHARRFSMTWRMGRSPPATECASHAAWPA